jgi:methylthioribose-1-phosphate isomerase
VRDVARVIKDMAVRGAPAIGCVAAYGMVFSRSLKKDAQILKASRPTAVNLAWAVNRMLKIADCGMRIADKSEIRNRKSEMFKGLLSEAKKIEREDVAINRRMGLNGAKLFKKNAVIMTHCNTGALATAGVGTALGVIRTLKVQKKIKNVFVNETRPYLQGARLTAWECVQEKIPHVLITDSMAGHIMNTEKVDGVIVGCDRVAANGDTANKIGTYALAVLAKHHKIPFYVAMPTSTLDLKISSGKSIPIEQRSSEEVTRVAGQRVAPEQTKARHPAFDVTPHELITAIVCERGVVKPPFNVNLKKLRNADFGLQNKRIRNPKSAIRN